jgi:[acyl-carrier-protein] S-malonyltransferase
MKTAFLFPGQGAQITGMGKDIAGAYKAAADIFEKANDVVGFDLRRICFEGPEDELNTTTMSQPAIYVTSAAILEVIRTNSSIKPDVVAGLSLGEYTALYAASLVSFEDGLKLVQKRGLAMQAAADNSKGGMVSIIGLDEDKVKELCDEASQGEPLTGVNYNCPGQIVISGSLSACERAEGLAEKYGAMKAIRLAVAGAFHSEYMNPAAEELNEALQRCEILDPCEIKVVSNINCQYYVDSDDIKQGLVKQLTSPILWQRCMEKLLVEGVEDYYEIGPGKALTGLMRRINRKTNINNISNLQALEKLLAN